MIDEDGFILPKKTRIDRGSLSRIKHTVKPLVLMTKAAALAMKGGATFVFDAEVYPNFFYVAFRSEDTGEIVAFEQSPGAVIDTTFLQYMLWTFRLVGFNSKRYDMPILSLVLKGASNREIYEGSMSIIRDGLTPWAFEKQWKTVIPTVNHIDLFDVAPLSASLKKYAARMHCRRMQELPFDPHIELQADEAEIVRVYCGNDLENTSLLLAELSEQVKLREAMSEEYGHDLRSKSDAQIAESVICSEVQKLTGEYPRAPSLADDFACHYKAPWVISFQTPPLQRLLELVQTCAFPLDGFGSPMTPPQLADYVFQIGGSQYKYGKGGIHSQESSVSHFADEETILCDIDVESFYPRIILNGGFCPAHIGPAFLQAYNAIVERRLAAKDEAKRCKKAGDAAGEKAAKVVADSLKITINGSFGKFGNKYSALYAPDLMLATTLSGQLLLLMLIEAIELRGIPVVSANTDGIVVKCPRARYDELKDLVAAWEKHTSLKTEETQYKSIHNRDVNNYYAIKTDGEIKLKGVYSDKGSALNSRLSKNPENYICSLAVQAFLTKGTPLAKTIRECRDIRPFLAIREVKGGGAKAGVYLGKVVRWYYAKNEAGNISYILSGNKVPKSDGARPVMDLPEAFPDDIDYDRYIEEAADILIDVGYIRKQETASLF